MLLNKKGFKKCLFSDSLRSLFFKVAFNSDILILICTSAVLVQNMSVMNGLITWPLVLLLADFSRTAHPNNFTLDAALHCVLSKTPDKCEVDRMNCCRENRRTHIHTDRQRLLPF